MSEEIICGLRIFFLADKAIVPTEANIPAGFSISVEPVLVFDYHDRETFVEVLWDALQRGNPDVPDPPGDEVTTDENGSPVFKNPIELKYAGVDSWEELECASIYASISVFPSGYVVDVFGRAEDGTWGADIAFEAEVPIEAGIGGVVDDLLAHLKTRTDLPVSRRGN